MNARTWSSSTEEEALVITSREIFAAMAALLHDVAEARYVEPLGGFDINR